MPKEAFIKHCTDAAWRVIRNAAASGTNIHAAVERYIGTGEVPPITELQSRTAVDAFMAYKQAKLERVVSSEFTFGDTFYEIGGTIDMIATHKEHGLCILDIKTQDFGEKGKPKFHQHYTYQLAAYARCWARRNNLPKDPRIITLAYPRDEPFPSFYEKVWSDVKQKQVLAVFEFARALHRAMRS
jgi:ATP-dependent exoDNAse (exonuclease V) beta subunit